MQSRISKLIKTSKPTKNQKIRWRKKGTIPCQVMIELWDMGIKTKESEPTTGMKIDSFIEAVWKLAHTAKDASVRDLAAYLYQDTVEKELMPNWCKNIQPKRIRLNGYR